MNRERPTDICVAKIGEPFNMRVCGKSCEYRTPERDGSRYEGWYHVGDSITDHHSVPKRMIG